MPTAIVLTADSASRATLGGCLAACGLKVVHAGSPEEARRAAAAGAEVAVLDLVLAGRQSGVEVARGMHADSPRPIPFYFLTAAPDEAAFVAGAPAELFLGGLVRRPVAPLDALERLGRTLPLPPDDLSAIAGAIPCAPDARRDLLASGPFDLAATPVDALLVAVALGEATGTLGLDGAGLGADLAFERGRLVAVGRAGEAFTLLDRSKVDPEVGAPPPPGDLEAELGYAIAARLVAPHRVEDAVRKAAARLVQRLRTLTAGAAAFFTGRTTTRRLPVSLAPVRLLLDARGDAARPLPVAGAVLSVRQATGPGGRPLGLTAGEAELLARVRAAAGRGWTLGKVREGPAGTDPAAQGEADRLLALLIDAGVVEIALPGIPPEQAAAIDELTRTLFDLDRRDPAGVLGLADDATPEAARAAFRELSKRYHPDRFHGAHPRALDLARRIQSRLQGAVKAIGGSAARRAEAPRPGETTAAEGRSDPERGRIDLQLGNLALRNGKLDRAREHLARAAHLLPDRAPARAAFGWVLFQTAGGDVDAMRRSAAELKRAVEIDPRCDVAHLYLGHVHKRRQDWEKARGCYRKAVECNPGNVEAQRELRLLDRRGQGAQDAPAAAQSGEGAWAQLRSLFKKAPAPAPADTDDGEEDE